MIDHTIQNRMPNYGMNYGFPNYITPQYRPVVYQNNTSTLVFVNGKEEAMKYPQAPGTTIILWDSEIDCFYRKSTDDKGNIIEFEICDYTKRPEEKTEQNQNDAIALLTKQVKELSEKLERYSNPQTPKQNFNPKKHGGDVNAKPNV